MKVLLADDHTIVRKGIRAVLASQPGIDIVAETADGREALALIEQHQPDLAVLDVTMPGLSGLEVAVRVAKISSRTKVLILSMHASEAYVAQALRAGVAGYLLKDAADDELPLAVKAVSRGEVYLSPKISTQLVDRFLKSDSAEPDPLAGLTTRQREILQLVAEGKSSKEIAVILDLSIKTVESHRGQIMERLDIHAVTGLVRFAIRVGLVSPDS